MQKVALQKKATHVIFNAVMEFKAKKVLKSAQKSPKILSKKSIHKPNVKVIQNSTKTIQK